MGESAQSGDKARPNLIDLGFQLAYVCAYQLMRTYWRLRRPTTHGALVAIFCQGQVLLVRNSYVPYYSAPGGYLQKGESARSAARRELLEEVGVDVSEDKLKQALEVTHSWEGKQDHVVIFTLEVDRRPGVQVDHREVVEAFWFTPEQVAQNNVFPPLKQAILEHQASD